MLSYLVNSPGWEQKLRDNQQQFAEAWVKRPAFKAAYDAMSNADYVNALYANVPSSPTVTTPRAISVSTKL